MYISEWQFFYFRLSRSTKYSVLKSMEIHVAASLVSITTLLMEVLKTATGRLCLIQSQWGVICASMDSVPRILLPWYQSILTCTWARYRTRNQLWYTLLKSALNPSHNMGAQAAPDVVVPVGSQQLVELVQGCEVGVREYRGAVPFGSLQVLPDLFLAQSVQQELQLQHHLQPPLLHLLSLQLLSPQRLLHRLAHLHAMSAHSQTLLLKTITTMLQCGAHSRLIVAKKQHVDTFALPRLRRHDQLWSSWHQPSVFITAG